MAENIALYRVFVATPGGLEEERRAFAKTIEMYNQGEAIHRQATFLPVGWEDTLSGVGRPQALINEDLERCDYFVMVLWDRWGTPPGGDHGGYTSGTEEEYTLAMKHLGDAKHPLDEVIVFFKSIEDARRLRDPGDQLKKVLRFKKGLESSKTQLFSTFSAVSEFEDLLRRHLAKWLRAHDLKSTSQTAKDAKLPQHYVAPGLVLSNDVRPSTSRSSSLTISLFAGNRELIPPGTEILLTLRDGLQQIIYRDFSKEPAATLQGLPFFDNFGDNYTVLASAKGYEQAGYTPVTLSPLYKTSVDLMLLKEAVKFNFAPARWELLRSSHVQISRLLTNGTADNKAARDRYVDLMESRPAVLACLFNLVTALSQIRFGDEVLTSFIYELIRGNEFMSPDRIFAWAKIELIDHLIDASARHLFAPESAASAFHPGATRGWKQIQFGEANIDLTFHEEDTRTISGVRCVKVELSFSYYKDLVAHAILEITANSKRGNLADPRQVYALRWMAGRHAGVPEFDPPYFLE